MRQVREKTKEKTSAVAHPLRNPPASFSHDLGDTLSWPAEGAEGSPLGASCAADAVEESGPLWVGTATVRGTHGCSAPAPSRTCGKSWPCVLRGQGQQRGVTRQRVFKALNMQEKNIALVLHLPNNLI